MDKNVTPEELIVQPQSKSEKLPLGGLSSGQRVEKAKDSTSPKVWKVICTSDC